MEEDIKNIERVIDYIQLESPIVQGLGNAIYTDSLKRLIKGYRELEEENQKLIYELQEKDDEIKFANRDIKVFETEFIPKSKIREKIEELKKKYELADDYWQYDYDVDMNTIEVLQELMEDK